MLQFSVDHVKRSMQYSKSTIGIFSSHYRSALVRLMKMCRGIGDPLLAAYARCYICRVSSLSSGRKREALNAIFFFQVTIDIDFNYREPIEVAFADLCLSFHQTDLAAVKAGYTAQKLTTSVYLSLYSPALDWIVQCLLYKLADKKIGQIIQQTRASLNIPRYAK